jgi:hypothetical protein
MNSVTSSSDTFPPGMGEILEDFLKHFYTWGFIKAERWGKNIYIMLNTGIFNDLHVKQFQKLARQHGFKLTGYGVRPISGGELLVTFVLVPRRR